MDAGAPRVTEQHGFQVLLEVVQDVVGPVPAPVAETVSIELPRPDDLPVDGLPGDPAGTPPAAPAPEDGGSPERPETPPPAERPSSPAPSAGRPAGG